MEMIVSRVNRNVKIAQPEQNSVLPGQKSSQIVVFFGFFNDWLRPGPPHVKIRQVPRKNGDKISSQMSNKGFLSGLSLPPGLRSTKEKWNESFV